MVLQVLFQYLLLMSPEGKMKAFSGLNILLKIVKILQGNMLLLLSKSTHILNTLITYW